MEYHIRRVDVDTIAIDAAEWAQAEVGVVGNNPWADFAAAPATTFQVLRGNKGFFVKMHTNESPLRAEVDCENGKICTDSCMEFFLKPDPFSHNYLNFEVNPKGRMHIGFGPDRRERLHIDCPRDIFRVESDAKDGDWTLKYEIPDSFLRTYFEHACSVMRGNFYKCGDLTASEHYAAWAPIHTPNPDFHLADFFDKLIVEES